VELESQPNPSFVFATWQYRTVRSGEHSQQREATADRFASHDDFDPQNLFFWGG